jgi:hypothetical protein
LSLAIAFMAMRSSSRSPARASQPPNQTQLFRSSGEIMTSRSDYVCCRTGTFLATGLVECAHSYIHRSLFEGRVGYGV